MIKTNVETLKYGFYFSWSSEEYIYIYIYIYIYMHIYINAYIYIYISNTYIIYNICIYIRYSKQTNI